jgi:hypothetical protein
MAYQVFICHAYDHQDIYFELVRKLNNARRFDWRNQSIQFDMRLDLSEAQLREEIARRIAASNVMLALTKPIATRREWLQWEINLAKRLNKPMIGVARRTSDRVSSFVRRQADELVYTWRADHIINAIEGLGEEYRKREQSPPLEELPPLVPAVTDIDVALGDTGSEERPRDVLFQEEATGPTAAILPRKPRWWWPFARRLS